MNAIDNFIFQHFEGCRNQIKNGVSETRPYLFKESGAGFVGQISESYSTTHANLKSWKVYPPDLRKLNISDKDIYESMKTFLYICSQSTKIPFVGKWNEYSGIASVMEELLSIVCLNNPRTLNFERYYTHITQSENIIKFILSVFHLEYYDKTIAYGKDSGFINTDEYINYIQSHHLDKCKEGSFEARQNLIGDLISNCTDSAISGLIYCMRKHRNHFSHTLGSDDRVYDKVNSESYQFITNCQACFDRLKYLVYDYITVYHFIRTEIELKAEVKNALRAFNPFEIQVKIELPEDYVNSVSSSVSLYDAQGKVEKTEDVYVLERFKDYGLVVTSLGGNTFKDRVNIGIKNLSPNIKICISAPIPPGKQDIEKVNVLDIINMDFFPSDIKTLNEVWNKISDEETADFIHFIQNVTKQAYCMEEINSPKGRDGLKNLKESVKEFIDNIADKAKEEVSFSDSLERMNREIADVQRQVQESLESGSLKTACELIDSAFAKLDYLKTHGTKDGVALPDQMYDAAKRFMQEGILDISNTQTDAYIDTVKDLTILDAILQNGDLEMIDTFLGHRTKAIIDSNSEESNLVTDLKIELYPIYRNFYESEMLKDNISAKSILHFFRYIVFEHINSEGVIFFSKRFMRNLIYLSKCLNQGGYDTSKLDYVLKRIALAKSDDGLILDDKDLQEKDFGLLHNISEESNHINETCLQLMEKLENIYSPRFPHALKKEEHRVYPQVLDYARLLMERLSIISDLNSIDGSQKYRFIITAIGYQWNWYVKHDIHNAVSFVGTLKENVNIVYKKEDSLKTELLSLLDEYIDILKKASDGLCDNIDELIRIPATEYKKFGCQIDDMFIERMNEIYEGQIFEWYGEDLLKDIKSIRMPDWILMRFYKYIVENKHRFEEGIWIAASERLYHYFSNYYTFLPEDSVRMVRSFLYGHKNTLFLRGDIFDSFDMEGKIYLAESLLCLYNESRDRLTLLTIFLSQKIVKLYIYTFLISDIRSISEFYSGNAEDYCAYHGIYNIYRELEQSTKSSTLTQKFQIFEKEFLNYLEKFVKKCLRYKPLEESNALTKLYFRTIPENKSIDQTLSILSPKGDRFWYVSDSASSQKLFKLINNSIHKLYKDYSDNTDEAKILAQRIMDRCIDIFALKQTDIVLYVLRKLEEYLSDEYIISILARCHFFYDSLDIGGIIEIKSTIENVIYYDEYISKSHIENLLKNHNLTDSQIEFSKKRAEMFKVCLSPDIPFDPVAALRME